MNCLQCGSEMKMKISDYNSETKKERSADYLCYKCDIGFHVIMFNIFHIENVLVLSTHGGLRVARNI